ncbi:MAG: Nucleoside-triphosphatase [uncultured bacterium]|nr:MAG: Nucleoside-triphosphatase [uncultured bacterium]
MIKLVLASSNKNKILEFKEIFRQFDIDIIGLSDLSFHQSESPEENGQSFRENADIKSRFYSKVIYNYVLADDSGLCVDSLNGSPGIFSARFAGVNATDELNNQKLLNDMRLIVNRSAKFVCALSLAYKGNTICNSYGEVRGDILKEVKGISGFGYDPIFYYPHLHKTFAELSFEQKTKVSHRFHAGKDMAIRIKKISL